MNAKEEQANRISRVDRAAAILDRALELNSTERDAYIQGACGDDVELRTEVEAMLRAHEEAGDFLASPTNENVATIPSFPNEKPGTIIDRYKILQLIGEGGFGAVYMAEQQKPVKRRVALKIIKLGMDTKQVIARFEAERQALAMMDHPNIARVFDAGATETGRPYFVMELVKGVPITEYCDTENLSTKDRLDLFINVCHAVQHAHQKGIIHRDIKPSNVMVTLHDGKPVPKVIDFGIAKATNRELTDKTLFTEYRQLVGTPQYMSPEQAEMSGLDIDTRSDIYSLGVLLYELLTGTTPFDPKRLRSAALGEIQRIIREEEPDKPSTRLSEMSRALPSPPGRGVGGEGSSQLEQSSVQYIAKHRKTDPAHLARQLRGDLDWIIMKALEKERARRYETANGLAADIQRHLSDEPVLAGAPSAAYRFRKFVRRHRQAVIAGGVMAGVLVLGVVGTTGGMIWALDEQFKAEQAAEQAQREAQRASKAEADTAQRAAELEQVAEFQSSQLSEIDAQLMGTRLRRAILDERRALLAGRGDDESAIESGLSELEQSLGGVNFTDIALGSLDENIFERALDAIEKDFADQPLIKAQLLQTIAVTLQKLGLLDRATEPQEEALRIRRETLGNDHADTRESIHNMGSLLHDQGKLAEAEAYYRHALESFRRELGDDHPHTLESINNLGSLLHDQGKLAESERYHREALEGFRRELGDDHPDTLGSINNMGFLLMAQGKLAQAEPYYREALEGRRRVLGDDHPRTLVSINNMGFLLVAQGKLAEGETYHREALEGRRRVLGDDHPSTLGSINNMGDVLHARGKLVEAEPYYRESLEGHRRVLGDDHPNTLTSINNMGVFLMRLGKFYEAEPYFREALQGRRALGDDHPSTLFAIHNMGAVYRAQGKLADAEPYYREALEGRRRVLGDEHPDTMDSLNSMGSLLHDQGKLAEAEPYIREALEGLRRVLGDDHPDTLIAFSNMGGLFYRQGKLAEAEPYWRDALESRKRVLGDDHPDTLLSISNMGALLEAQGKLAEAETYHREALEGRRRVLGDEHPSTLNSIITMGYLFDMQGRFAEAEQYLREGLEGRRKVLPARHGSIASSLAVLSLTLIKLGRYVEAEMLLGESLAISQETLAADHWQTFNTLSLLGGALAGQGADPALTVAVRIDKFHEAESLLMESYNGLRANENEIPGVYREARLRQALERIVQLYERWHAAEPDVGYDARAASWRAELQQKKEPQTVDE